MDSQATCIYTYVTVYTTCLPNRGSHGGRPRYQGSVGSAFLERTRIVSGIQFTGHFIEIVVVGTKQWVRCNSNVILMRKTFWHRSSMSAAGSKSQALGNYFSMWIWCIFPWSNCRGDLNPGLWTWWVTCGNFGTCANLCTDNVLCTCLCHRCAVANWIFFCQNTFFSVISPENLCE